MTGAKEMDGEFKKLLRDNLRDNSIKASPINVSPSASRRFQYWYSSILTGSGVTHSTSVENFITAIFTSVDASPTPISDGSNSSIVPFKEPIFVPFILPETSIRKKIVILFFAGSIVSRKSSSKAEEAAGISSSNKLLLIRFFFKRSSSSSTAFRSTHFGIVHLPNLLTTVRNDTDSFFRLITHSKSYYNIFHGNYQILFPFPDCTFPALFSTKKFFSKNLL